MKRIAVILSGCGVYDGAEIHESVLTLLSLSRRGAEYACFAPDIAQLHVVNHLTGEVDDSERNVLVEAARIARGEISDLKELDVSKFDGVILPGGFGAAKNLCDFAVKGSDASVNEDVLNVCKDFAEAEKPAAYACIAPAIIPFVYPKGVKLTIGNDKDTASALAALGAEHVDCEVEQVTTDDRYKVFSTPAYMLASNISEAADSIDNLVAALLDA